MIGYRDAQNRELRMRRDAAGNLISITTSRRRGIKLTYDVANRITRARKHFGRVTHVVTYTYDSTGRLIKVRTIYVDILGVIVQMIARIFGLSVPDEIARRDETKEYTYDDAHQMLTIKEPGIFITNDYDSGGRVIGQRLSDGRTYKFAYILSQGRIVQTDVTEPDGSMRRVIFNADGYSVSDTYTPRTAQRSITYSREAGNNRVLTVTLACSPEHGPVKNTAPVGPGETVEQVESRLLQKCE
jgi:YD repeat-containing protein